VATAAVSRVGDVRERGRERDAAGWLRFRV
jgi:hypothetical protein